MFRSLRIGAIVWAFVLLGSTGLAANADSESDGVVEASLDEALRAFADRSGLQLVYPAELAEGKTANHAVAAARNAKTREQELDLLLAGTGLGYRFVNAHTVAIDVALDESDDDEGGDPPNADEAASDDEDAAADDDSDVETIYVTGTRLPTGDPAAVVYSITEAEISARGVSSLEELFRTIPWSFGSITTQTNMGTIEGIAGDSHTSDDYSRGLGLGVSTVNLRGLGSENTLVLVNGRRIAGMAGHENDIANILQIPLASIERVDIQLEGGSAVYGSDAIGGIVNFVTKKGYKGVAASYRHELSSTDADATTLTLLGGYGWRSGDLTATLSRNTTAPIVNAKTGWTTLDYRAMLGPEFDLRIDWLGQPGVVCEWLPNLASTSLRCSWDQRQRYQLPADHDGVDASVEDFNLEVAPFELVPLENGDRSQSDSLTVFVEQTITDRLRIHLDYLYSDRKASQAFHDYIPVLVPRTNAFNPFGRHVVVRYAPVHEVNSGLMPASYAESISRQQNFNLGLAWRFAEEQELRFDATRSTSRRTARRVGLLGRRPPWDPGARPYYEALQSSDPDRAINLFGNGTAQGSAFYDLPREWVPNRGNTETDAANLSLRGRLFDMWGGTASYSVGGEYRESTIYWRLYYNFGVVEQFRVSSTREHVGFERPTRNVGAYYAEASLPFFGPDNARRGLRSLTLTLQARYDFNSTQVTQGGETERFQLVEGTLWDPDIGDFTTVTVGHYTREYDLDPKNVRQSATSPRVGLVYKPMDNLTLRASWSRSFRPPVWSDLGTTEAGHTHPGRYHDPYDPDGRQWILIPNHILKRWNPGLKNEFSDNYSLALEWSPEWMPGLRGDVHWSLVDYTNKIVNGRETYRFKDDLLFANPNLVVRDEDGYAVFVYDHNINLQEKMSEIVNTRLIYSFPTDFGNFEAGVNYTRYLRDYARVLEGEPKLSTLGTQDGNDRYNIRGWLRWSKGNATADLFVYHSPGYLNDDALTCRSRHVGIGRCESFFQVLELEVGSLTTVDLNVTYRLDNGLQLRAGGRNILNRQPPNTVRFTYPYDPTRWDARGRVFSLEARWNM